MEWPVWFNTGVRLSDGSQLTVPLGHSQYTWLVSGPLVNARVAFFLGINGAGFFAQIDARPAWVGRASRIIVRSWEGHGEQIAKASEVASRYLRRVRCERDTVAKGMPAGGYGFIGVCNDSTAAIETVLKRSLAGKGLLPYPTVRAASLAGNPCAKEDDDRGDELEAIFARIPHDADVSAAQFEEPRYKAGILCRALDMTPYPLDSPQMPDETMRRQLKLAKKDAGDACR